MKMNQTTFIILLACIIGSAWSYPAQIIFPDQEIIEKDSSAVLDLLKALGKSEKDAVDTKGIVRATEIPKLGNKESNGSVDVFTQISHVNQGIKMPVYEGDILRHEGRSAINCTSCLWPKSVDGTVIVPYNFSFNYSANQLALFKSAMQEYESLTCVRFVPRTKEVAYLNIISGNGCSSFLGRLGNAQTVELASYGCMYMGIIQHELNHALGFYHEQSRSDRDDYVTIITENIIPGYANNFNKYNSKNLGLEYDYSSVMHYAGDAFSKNGNRTIVPKPDPSVPIGQRNGLSILDVSKINRLYQCDVCSNLLSNTNGIMISANYPSTYPHNTNCVWLIRTPSGQVTLQFQAFDTQSAPGCVSDYIRIYDGPTKTSPMLVDRACGTGLIPLQIASTNQMLVEFVSDGAVTGTGFKATYSSVPCGGAFYAPNKTFTSPNYPENYYTKMDCTWTITAPVGYKISLNMNDFKLENSRGCMYDSMTIYNTTQSQYPYCGSIQFSFRFVSISNSMMIKFHSDISIVNRGFSATYTFGYESSFDNYNTENLGLEYSSVMQDQEPHHLIDAVLAA
ncbi:embryonic protein UVS.2-like [Xenopus laevis]|uniref:Metalloendopeptidase n=1 Tax=Xenopus laevis TaxID=8355 RepID=A0A8J1LKR5_XENLA|nr:embryonic protein UVS.2-like [Xenopus laevis]